MIMRKICTLVLFVSALLTGIYTQAQVTTNTGSGLAPTYPTLDQAITALNAASITSSVVINLTGPETSPVGGYVITAQGSSTNTITINGGGFTITGNNGLTAGAFNDAIFKLKGADWVTLQGFNIVNNTNTANGTLTGVNTRYEFGIALFAETTTNGAQNNTIRNNTINMAGAGGPYANSFGILSNSAQNDALTTAAATANSGTNSNTTIQGNTIIGCNHGIMVTAPNISAGVEESGLVIGGSGSGEGNTIEFAAGTANTATMTITNLVANLPTGIQVKNVNNTTVSYNTVTINPGSLRTGSGINIYNTALQTSAGFRTVNNNTITIKLQDTPSSSGGTANGIDLGGNASSITLGTLVDATANNNQIRIELDFTPSAPPNNTTAAFGIRIAGTTSARTVQNNSIAMGHLKLSTGDHQGNFDHIIMNGSSSASSITITGNSLTTGSNYHVRSSGPLNGINIQNITALSGAILIDDNTINLERGQVVANAASFGMTCNLAFGTSQTISNNRVTLSGTHSASQLDGLRINGANTAKTITGNSIVINMPSAVINIAFTGIWSTTGRSVITNNTVSIDAATSSSGPPTLMGIRAGAGTANIAPSEVKTNIVNMNINGVGVTSSPTINGIFIETTSSHTYQVENNQIQSISATHSGAASTIEINGIRFNAGTLSSAVGAGNHIVRGNRIGNLSTLTNTGVATMSGITIGAGTTDITSASTVDVSNNVIGGVTNRHGNGSIIRGIRILRGPQTQNYFNNRISLVGDIMPNGSGANQVIGIDQQNNSGASLSTYNIYHNSVHVNVTSTTGNLGTSAFNANFSTFVGAGMTVLRNNIFENLSSPSGTGLTTAVRVGTTTYSNYSPSSNNNYYFAGTADANRLIFFDGTNSEQTIAGFKTRMGGTREFNSQPTATLAAVPFVSTDYTSSDFLRIDPNASTDVSNNAVLITGYTTDFEGDTRPAAPSTTPDIGADEYVVACVRPNTPPSITLTNSGSGEITVNFGASVPTAPTGGYIIVRNTTGVAPTVTDGNLSTLGGGGGTIISTQATNAAYVDAGLTNGTTYYYYIFAYNAGGCAGTAWWAVTPRSGSLTALAPCTTPANPGTVNLSNITTASINVGWVAASPAPSGYLVVRSTGAPTGLPPVNGTTYTVGSAAFGGVIDYIGTANGYVSAGLAANTSYTYTVYSFNSSCGGAPVYSLLNSSATGSTTLCLAPGTYNVGPTSASYPSITQVVSVIGTAGCPLTGDYYFRLRPDYVSTVETFPLVIPTFVGSSATNRVFFTPGTGASNLEITSSNATGTINFQGSSHVIFDGRVNGAGATRNLSIVNTNVGTSPAISFTSSSTDANNITLQYLTIRSANNSSTSGTITMGTGGSTGFNNITINQNVIREAPNGTDFPANGIYANSNNPSRFNETIIITNNNIQNFYHATSDMAGIRAEGNFRGWTISANNFFQTGSRAIAGRFSFMFLSGSTLTGSQNIQITGNFLGGTGVGASGAALTLTGSGSLRGIVLGGGNGTASSISNNLIRSISFTSSGTSTENSFIHALEGRIDIGTAGGNTLGQLASSNNCQLALTGSPSNFAAILVGNATNVGANINVENNTIAGFALSSSTGGANFQAIQTFGVSAPVTISSNFIGDVATASSINSSANTNLRGIWARIGGTQAQTISNNRIVNLTATGTGTQGLVAGIFTEGTAPYTIESNQVYTLRSASTNASNQLVVVGISANATNVTQTIRANRIYDLAATASTTPSTIAGIYLASTTVGGNQIIERNFIHSLTMSTVSTSGSIYGMVINSGAPNTRNNKVRLGINATGASVTTAFATIGILEESGSLANYFYNTVYIGGSGVGNGNVSYAFLSLVASGTRNIRNNIFYNVRSSTSGATSNHYAIFLQASTGLTSNNNVFVANGTNGTLGTINTTNYSTLVAWRTATGQDAQSFSALVPFVNATGNSTAVDLHINAAQASHVEGNGQGLVVATNDYDTDARSTSATPPTGTDIGADEGTFTAVASPIDVGISAFVTPDASGCFTSTQAVIVTIRNYRSTAIAAGTNIPVQVTINGAITATLSGTYSGGIAANGTVDFTVGTADMSANGTYNLRATVNPAGAFEDADISNDFLQVARTRAALTAGSVSVPSASSLFCGAGGVVTATVTGAGGGTIQWQTSPDNSTWTNVGTVNSLTYTTPSAITQTTFFRVRVSCGGTDVFSNSDTAELANPVITSTTGTTKCGPGLATISAVTPTSGAAINWFLTPTGGGIVGTGASFSPFVNSAVTYYASAELATTGTGTGTFGTSTTTNTSSGFPSPYTNYYGGNKHQMMIRATELTAAGFSAGNIQSLAFTLTGLATNLLAAPSLNNFSIAMKAVPVGTNTLNGSLFETGFVTVLPAATLTLPTSGFPVDVVHTFTTPFYWDGVSNLVIQTSYTNGNFGTTSDAAFMRFSDPGFLATTVYYKDSDPNINTFLNATIPSNSYSSARPNMKLVISNSCSSPRIAVNIGYTAPPALGISASSASICAGGSTTVNVTPGTIGNFTSYSWSPALGATLGGTPVGSSVSFAPAATTKYVLTATNGSGCTNLDSVVVSVVPTPSPLTGTNYTTCVASVIPGGQGLIGNGSGSISNIAGSVVSGPTYIRSTSGTTYAASTTNTYYHTFSFTVTTSGSYTLNGCATSAYTDMHASIYLSSFNPASPATNFLQADDDGNGANCGLGSRLTLNLTAGVTYVLVTGTFGSSREMDFNWTYTGPGQLQSGFSPSVYYWYAAPTGGTPLATGVTTFNPVGVVGSGVPNTNTPGTFTFYLAQNNGLCESSRTPVDLIIRPATVLPTSLLANGVNPLVTCGGTNNVTLTQAGGTLGGGGTWQWHRNATFSDLIATTTNNNAQVTLTQNPSTSTTYYLRAVGATCGTATLASGLSVAVTVNPNGTWIGTNTNWSDPANWCGGVPTSTTNVAVPNYGTGGNYPILAGGTTASINNLTLNTNSSITLQPTATLNIAGAMINDGRIINRGEMVLNGTGNQNFPGTGTGTVGYLNQLTIDKSSGNTTLNRSFTVHGALIPTRGNVQVDSLITIRSTNDTTARVGIVGAGVNLTYGTAGRFSIERYVPAKRAWRLLTSPTTAATSQSINAAWQEGVTAWPMGPATGLTNPVPGYGTHISGGTQANGYDQNVNGNASIRVYSSGWQNMSVATSLLSKKVTDERAYMVFVRGSRGLNMAQGQYAIPDVTTLRSSGRINVANATPFTVTSSGLTLAGNPFPSAINFKQLATNNGFLNDPARNLFYLWDPTLAGNRNVGAFVTVAYNVGTGNYDRSVTSTGVNYTTAGGNQGIDNQGTIQSGLGFFMNFGGTSNTVSFAENIKVAGSTSAVFRPGPQLRATLRTRMADGSTPINDGVLVNFHPIFSNDADDHDVKKVENFTENMSLWRDGTLFSIERRKPPVAGDTLHLRLRNLVINNFQFEFAPDSLIYPQLQAFLIDRHLGTETPISLKDTTRYDFTIAANPASIWAEDRFAIVFKPNVGNSVVPVTITSIRAARRDQHINVEWNVENEINIRHYTVERSQDGRNFSDLGQVQAAGRATSTYNWLDQQPFAGDNFYRIRYTNADGSVGYSRIVKVDAGKIGRAIVVYPNPVTDGIIGTEFRNMPAGVYQARLLNGGGQTIFLKHVTHPGGTALLQIQPDFFLVPGNYQLDVTGPDKTKQTIQVLVK